jgi:hypothetical protein
MTCAYVLRELGPLMPTVVGRFVRRGVARSIPYFVLCLPRLYPCHTLINDTSHYVVVRNGGKIISEASAGK